MGDQLITPAIMIAYIWVWAGFAMVVIAAGLAAIPRDVLEAARTDGASEWQTFIRVTVPLLAPILSVVFITMVINVLKVFDIVISVAPSSSAMRRTRPSALPWAGPPVKAMMGKAVETSRILRIVSRPSELGMKMSQATRSNRSERKR